MSKVILLIEGMTCSACSAGLEKNLKKQVGVRDAVVNLIMATASIDYDEKLSIKDLEEYVKKSGFKSLGVYYEHAESNGKKKKTGLIVSGIIAIFVLYISMSNMFKGITIPLHSAILLFLFSIYFLVYGFDILRNGVKNIIYRSPNMDTLVSIGVITSFLYSSYNLYLLLNGNVEAAKYLYFESCCIVIYLIKLGRYIDNISKDKTKEAIKSLVTITPKTALIKKDDEIFETTLDLIRKGNILVAKPGMKIAVDGKIVKGTSHFDETFISGESVPVKKTVGDNIVAGSINVDGAIEYEAEKIGKESTISEIVRLIVNATNTKPKIARIADKVSSIFVPIIVLIAIITLVVNLILGQGINIAILSFVTVLVVACPCALGLATPLAIVVSVGECAKNGILVKKSATLELIEKINKIVFDKTGTITYGKFKIDKIFNYSNYKKEELLSLTASLEKNSMHPIAKAFYDDIQDFKEVESYREISGVGLTGVIDKKTYYIGNNKLFDEIGIENKYIADEKVLKEASCSIVYIVENDKVIALIGVRDIVRENVSDEITKLYGIGKDILMLTGDNIETATKIANEIGIKNVIANVSPKEKADNIKELMKENKVMMVGDGINDAPSLVLSSVGVSLSSGTDIAENAADIILVNNNIKSIYNLFEISKRTIKVIKINLFWAFFYNICMIPIAAGLFRPFGITINPMIASLTMTLSSLCVVINSLRLKYVIRDEIKAI